MFLICSADNILQLKSRPCGCLKQFACDTVLTYKQVRCAPVLDKSLYPTIRTTFELEYSTYS
jgi:hypothetical protein